MKLKDKKNWKKKIKNYRKKKKRKNQKKEKKISIGKKLRKYKWNKNGQMKE